MSSSNGKITESATEPEGGKDADVDMLDDALESSVLDADMRQWSEDKVNKLIGKVSTGMDTLPILVEELKSTRMSYHNNTSVQIQFDEALDKEKATNKDLKEQIEKSWCSIEEERQASAVLKGKLKKMKKDLESAKSDLGKANLEMNGLQEEFNKMVKLRQEAENKIYSEKQVNAALEKKLLEMETEKNLLEGSWSRTTGLSKAHAIALEEKWRAKTNTEVARVKQEYETQLNLLKKDTQKTNSMKEALEDQLDNMKKKDEYRIDQLKKMKEERDFAKAALLKANSINSQYRARFESAERKIRNFEEKQESGKVDLRLMLNEHKTDHFKKEGKRRRSSNASFGKDDSENSQFDKMSVLSDFDDELTKTTLLTKAKRARISSSQGKARSLEDNRGADLTDLRQILER